MDVFFAYTQLINMFIYMCVCICKCVCFLGYNLKNRTADLRGTPFLQIGATHHDQFKEETLTFL